MFKLKKGPAAILSFLLLLSSVGIPVRAEENNLREDGDGIVLCEYDMDSFEAEFSMELFEEMFTVEDVKVALAAEKAEIAMNTYEYIPYSPVTDGEVQVFYEEVESLAARAPGINYYFSRVYWQCRYSSAEGQYLLTLTLTPTSNVIGNLTVSMGATMWTLLKQELSSSIYWRDEASIKQQFDCHVLGAIYLGDIGDWDLEPDRPTSGTIQYILNQCNLAITGQVGSECASLNGSSCTVSE